MYRRYSEEKVYKEPDGTKAAVQTQKKIETRKQRYIRTGIATLHTRGKYIQKNGTCCITGVEHGKQEGVPEKKAYTYRIQQQSKIQAQGWQQACREFQNTQCLQGSRQAEQKAGECNSTLVGILYSTEGIARRRGQGRQGIQTPGTAGMVGRLQ
jgi:hypothetical protein